MRLRHLVCLLAMAAALLPASPLGAQGIGYSLTPTINFLRWDDDLGIRSTYLYGGRFSFDFGPALSLGGYYLTRQGAETDAAAAFPDVPLPDRELDISHFGADMTLSLGTGGFAPFLRGGGGVLRLRPEDGRRTDQVVLKAGGGLRFDLVQGIQGELFAEDWIFRINRNRLFLASEPDGPLPPDPEFEDLRHNLALGLGMRIPFGGDPDDQEGWLRGAAIPIEPFIGRLQFDDELALADQNLLGIRTGLDLTRHVGVRGYYWRGMTSDFTDTEPVQSYGGEVQFNLNTGPGISPYLVAGAGQLDFGAGFLDEQEQPQSRSDETMLILGGGASLGLSERLRLNVGLRDHLLTVGALEDAARLDDLFHNWMLSAGLTFSLGGTTAPSRMAPSERERLSAEVERLRRENERLRERREAEAEREGRQQDERAREGERREGETARERERREEQTARERERRAGETTLERELREERERVERLRQEIEELEERTERRRTPERERVQEIRMREGERAIAVPLPASGDLVIRYGGTKSQGGERVVREPAAAEAGLSRSELRDVIRQE
ncbi:MAG TPA: hypothetical protein VGR27_06005, partial [Longimicrobiaceae bacterium]|nr:hypothetical protein [Longimicrobiaceae bacterium]